MGDQDRVRVVVIASGNQDEHRLDSPWLGREQAEKDLAAIRNPGGSDISLPWLSINPTRVIAVYLTNGAD